jgi:hypothetical protein
MATSSDRLYSAPQAEVDYNLVRQFVLDAEAADLFTESLTFEAKEKRDHTNVVEAVSALSNTDGGIVLVGVKDRGAVDEARIVGIPQPEHDHLVNQLHALIPNAMPEVIVVAKPGTDRIVVVLRVDADAVLHPVIVNGKVLYRIPGEKAAADRQRVIDMIARDNREQAQTGPMQIAHPAWSPKDEALWADSTAPATFGIYSGELRVVGGLTLPQRILNRPWLNTKSKRAAVDVLNNSPLRNSPSWSLQTWLLTEARSSTLHYQSSPVPDQPVSAEAEAFVRLAGRELAVLVGFRWFEVDTLQLKLGLDNLYEALLSCIVTVASTSAHIARSLDAAAPTEPRIWEAWLMGSDGKVLDAIDISPFSRDNKDENPRAFFPATKVPVNDLIHLDQAARDWMTYWLLDIGARGFEDWLAKKVVPSWLRWPELA